jgi:aromatic-L-amino-acid/L-tryptophan decarboxylase
LFDKKGYPVTRSASLSQRFPPVAGSLELPHQERARMTADVLALCQEYWDTLPTKRVWTEQNRASLDAILKDGIPEQASAWESVLEVLRAVLESQAHLAHPRFFAFVPSPNNFVSCLADLLVSVHNPFASTWLEGSGAQTIERAVADWLVKELELPDGADGLFTSGGSASNLTALVTARDWRFGLGDWSRGTVYFSDQTHHSILKALRILGFSHRQIRILPSGNEFRLPAASLRSAIQQDTSSGAVPFCVVANAGTTNTGAVDPLTEIAEICKQHQMWLHADGAYGAAGALCNEGKECLMGLPAADSISIDPHKWLFQPYDCGCLLVRDASRLHQAFHISAEYLQDTEGEWNLWDYGMELTRRCRALKVWLSLQVFGASAFRAALSRGIHLARFAERQIRELSSGWEVVTPASLGVVTFRYSPRGASEREIAELNSSIAKHSVRDGFAFIATTQLKEKTALRLCTINPRTTEHGIVQTLIRLRGFGKGAKS